MKSFRKMTLAIVIIVFLLCVVGVYVFAPHAPGVPKQVTDRLELDTYFERLVQSGNPPSLTVVVVKDGHTVYNRAFGLADGPRKAAATPETVYHWWSMTKIPTAMAILQLQDQGRLNIDDSVVTHLPWFEVTYPAPDSPAITLRHLLQHSSGLPDVAPAIIGWLHNDDAGRDQTALVKKYLPAYKTLKFTPGEKAVYSNLNYMVLGAVIEAVSGQSYESYITARILQPLGMSRTGFVVSGSMAEDEASGSMAIVHFFTPLLPFFVDTRNVIRETQGKLFWFKRVYIDVTPSTGLIGPTTDIASLMLAFLNGGSLDGVQILMPESVELMAHTPPLDGHSLGWSTGSDRQRFYLEHTGGGPGFATFMRIYPDEGLGIALQANGTDLNSSGLANLLAGMDW